MEQVGVAVVGGGQSGLAVSYHLTRRGIDHVVFERGRSGDSWRHRWDSFCLVTPNSSLQLPGFPYDGDDPDGFIPRDGIADYVEHYRDSFDAPIRENTTVTALRPGEDGWHLATDAADWHADSVVVATGAYQIPSIPPPGTDLDPAIVQVHSHDYRSQEQLPHGAVLVVGSGQSGTQIVDDLMMGGRDTWLAVSRAGRAPRRYRGRDVYYWLIDTGFIGTPLPDGSWRFAASGHVSGRDGGKHINLRAFGRDGVHLVGRVRGADGTVMRFDDDVEERINGADEVAANFKAMIDTYIEENGIEAPPDDAEVIEWQPDATPTEVDLAEHDINAVVWATGYHLDFSWIDADAFGERGYPSQQRGVTPFPGLYFIGLQGMHSVGSSLFFGVGADAEHIVDHIEAR